MTKNKIKLIIIYKSTSYVKITFQKKSKKLKKPLNIHKKKNK